MKLTLARFGSEVVEIDPSTLIKFPKGLPGFEDCNRFKLFHSGDSPIVFWLQSVEDLAVVFSLADPDLLKISYDLTLTDEEQDTLRVTAGDELQIAVMLSQQEQGNTTVRSILANSGSPLIINVSKRIAIQKQLNIKELSIRA